MKRFSRLVLLTAAAAALTGCSNKDGDASADNSAKETNPESISYGWQTPYEEKIGEFKSSDEYTETSAFDIIDVTGDKKPELIISLGNDATAKSRIYTYKDDAVTDLGEIGNYGTFSYCPETNVIKDEFQGNGFILGKIYSLKTFPLNTLLSYSDNSDSASMGGEIYHEINGEHKTLAEYEEALAPFSALNAIEVGRRFTMGENAVNYGLRYSESWKDILTDEQKKLCKGKLEAEMELAKTEERNAAFDFCDFNGDKVPELVISDDNSPESTCKVYYFSAKQLALMEGTYGVNGVLSFDTEQYIFFADNGAESKYWSIANSAFLANEYKRSESIILTGRKYPLNESGISAVFD